MGKFERDEPAASHIADPAANANPTASTVGDQGATQNTGWGADSEAHFDEIRTVLNQLIVDVAAGKTATDANNTAIDAILVALENAGIDTNCNTVPFDPSTPFKPSGVRIGTPSVTTRGMRKNEMEKIGTWIATILLDINNIDLQNKIKQDVKQLCKDFPVNPA